MISSNWKALNDRNFIEAPCFKIVTCDPDDDTVENFSSLHVGIGIKYAKYNYDEPHWKTFYDALCLLFECEDILCEKMKVHEMENLRQEILKKEPLQITQGLIENDRT